MGAPRTLDMSGDSRQPVAFPPPMRAHMLANMRGHLQALSGIVAALADARYADAAGIADAQLGVASPSAQGCKTPDDAAGPPMSPVAGAGHGMNRIMPEAMRAIGMGMHQAAGRFADEANKASASGDVEPALAALAQVTQQCVACHAAYRAQ